MSVMQRDERMDAVRLAANFMIVFLHSFAAFQYCQADTIEFKVMSIFCVMASCAMPALFCISGYLMAKGLTWGGWRAKIYRRIKRLLVPLIAWNVVFVIAYLALGAAVPRLGARVASFGLTSVSGILSKVVGLVSAPIDMPVWYMRTVFIYALLSPFLVWALRKCKGSFVYVGLLGWLVFSDWMGWGEVLEHSYPVYSLVVFTIGAHCAVDEKPIIETFARSWLWPVAFAATVGLGIRFMLVGWEYSIWRDVMFVCAMPMMFLASNGFVALFSKIPERAHKFLSQSSFFLYCSHFLFCSILMHTVAPMLRGMGVGKFVVLSMVFVLGGIPICLIVYLIGRRTLGKRFGVLDGSL